MSKIYLDYASITPVDPRVYRVIKKYSGREYGNPSALYRSAVLAREVLKDARVRVAKVIHSHPDEIIFTGSGTESNNIAILGIVEAYQGKHIIVSSIEHSSVLETAKVLEKKGVKVTYLEVDKNGLIDSIQLKKSITPDTVLVSVMLVNNEIGTIEPIHDIAKIVRDARKSSGTIFPLLHTDACQAPVSLDIFVEKMNVDLLTLDGHKIYGPRGVGMLYVRRGIKCAPVVHGGLQERGLRSGTENIPGILGFATALELVDKRREKESVRIMELKKYFATELKKINPEIKVNGDLENGVPHILNISIPNIDSEFFVLQLDTYGIECSTKSACLRDSDESYVLKSIGVKSENSIRFSFGKDTKKKDIKKVLKIIDGLLEKGL